MERKKFPETKTLLKICCALGNRTELRKIKPFTDCMSSGNLTTVDLPSVLEHSNAGNSESLLLWTAQRSLVFPDQSLWYSILLKQQIKLIFAVQHSQDLQVPPLHSNTWGEKNAESEGHYIEVGESHCDV